MKAEEYLNWKQSEEKEIHEITSKGKEVINSITQLLTLVKQSVSVYQQKLNIIREETMDLSTVLIEMNDFQLESEKQQFYQHRIKSENKNNRNETNDGKEFTIDILSSDQIHQLEEWTELKCSEIVFDSIKDDWNERTSIFNERIIGKKRLLFLIKEKDNELFGYHFAPEIVDEMNDYDLHERLSADETCFSFILSSPRKSFQPMKYEVNKLENGGLLLFDNDDAKGRLISLGDITLMKEMDRQYCICLQSGSFNYHGVKNPLCSKTVKSFPPKVDDYFVVDRIVVVQMN